MTRFMIVGACLLAAAGCGDGGSSNGGGTGGSAASGGTGGSSGTGGNAATGGTGGTAGNAGTGGSAGTSGTGGVGGTPVSLGIECDPIVRLDDYDEVNGGPNFLDFAYGGDHAAAIWNERGGGFEGVVVARYNFVTDEWSDPFDVFLETDPGFTPFTDIAIDVDGDVTSLVREVAGGDHQLWTRTYSAATDTWGAPEEADSDNYPTFNGWHLRYDRATGEPLLTFLTPSQARTSVFFTRRGPSGWGGDVLLEQNDNDTATDLDFVVNDVGQGLLTYSIDVSGGAPTYYVLPYDNGDFRRNGANAFDPFSTTTMALFGVPALHLDDTGKGVLLIDDSFATDRTLYTVDIDIGADTFGSQVLIHETESPFTVSPVDVARSENGTVIAAWGQTRTVGGQAYPWATVFDGAWSTPLELADEIFSGTWGAEIDASGTATVAWASGFPGVFATRNTGPGGAFIEPQEITGQVQLGSGNLSLAAHDSGDFLAVWQENRTIRAARCRSTDP